MTRKPVAAVLEFASLQALTGQQLLERAHAEDWSPPCNLDRGELLKALLEHHFDNGGTAAVEGVLEILPDGFAFLRTPQHDYAAGPTDVYVSPSQVRNQNLKSGHRLAGPVRPPKRGEKYFALVHIERVNGGEVDSLRGRVPFASRTPVLPTARLRLDHADAAIDLRVIDRLAPWGMGQRVLVVAPPDWNRAGFLARVAQAIAENHGDLGLVVCLLDQRPEDATATKRALADVKHCEVVATTFDEPPARHVALAETVLAASQREVEAGRDVVILFDSLTTLARASHLEQPPSGRLLCAGLDATAVQRGKRLFAAARACEEGGSLTVVATAVHGESLVDAAILAEFSHRGNSEVVVDAGLVAAGVEPPLDVLGTRTRNEDELGSAAARASLQQWRQELAGLAPMERAARVIARLQAATP